MKPKFSPVVRDAAAYREPLWTRSLVLIVSIFFLPHSIVVTPLKDGQLEEALEVWRVLILNDLNSVDSHGVALIDQGIYAGLEKSQYQIELYKENPQTTLFPIKPPPRAFREWLIAKILAFAGKTQTGMLTAVYIYV